MNEYRTDNMRVIREASHKRESGCYNMRDPVLESRHVIEKA